mgnify:FL=1|jgi:hypothetical protein
MAGWLDLGHPHETDGDFFRSHGMDQENAPSMDVLHPRVSEGKMQEAGKKAAMGLVIGAVVGGALLQIPAWNKMMSKQKSWQAAAVGAAVAVPLVAVQGQWMGGPRTKSHSN